MTTTETTWQVRYGCDFANVGGPGLSFMGTYDTDSSIRPLTGDESEWERNMTVSYVIQRGPLKDLNIALHHRLSLQKR